MQHLRNLTVGDPAEYYGRKKRKGGLGNLLEEVYFGYAANSDPKADFEKAGVELKATPYEKKKDGTLRAGERLVLTMISYEEPVVHNFEESHLWKKCRVILLIYYWRDKRLDSNLKYLISYAQLFTPPPVDLEIIKHDYAIIIGKIESGKADELSEGDTLYLGACTKGSTAAKSWAPQYYPPHTLAKKRAFCYKISYMNMVLNKYIVNHVDTCEAIIKDVSQLKNTSFEQLVMNKINQYAGKTDYELCREFYKPYLNNKAQWIDLAYRMLGIRSNRAEEFLKANITVKAIRLDEKGRMRENSPLPAFQYNKIIQDEWEDSPLYNYLENTKFLFVVFKKQDDKYVLRGCKLWNMPYHDLNDTVKDCWEKVRQIIIDGVQLKKVRIRSNGKEKIIVQNNFPSKDDNPIVHVRPHARFRFFDFGNDDIIGDEKYRSGNANPLPDGRWMPNYSFWLNNTYILSQLPDSLK